MTRDCSDAGWDKLKATWDAQRIPAHHTEPMGTLLRILFGKYDRRGGFSVFAGLFGIFACLSSCAMAVFIAPSTVAEGRRIESAPRPMPDTLRTLPIGERIVLTGLLPDATPDRTKFALYELQTLRDGQDWQRARIAPESLELQLSDGSSVSLRSPQTTQLHEATQENTWQTKAAERFRGYLPGQTVTVYGQWNGTEIIAEAIYPRTIEAFVEYLSATAPLQSFAIAGLCGVMGAIGLIASVVWRVVSRMRL
jgi:hypothetical protein